MGRNNKKRRTNGNWGPEPNYRDHGPPPPHYHPGNHGYPPPHHNQGGGGGGRYGGHQGPQPPYYRDHASYQGGPPPGGAPPQHHPAGPYSHHNSGYGWNGGPDEKKPAIPPPNGGQSPAVKKAKTNEEIITWAVEPSASKRLYPSDTVGLQAKHAQDSVELKKEEREDLLQRFLECFEDHDSQNSTADDALYFLEYRRDHKELERKAVDAVKEEYLKILQSKKKQWQQNGADDDEPVETWYENENGTIIVEDDDDYYGCSSGSAARTTTAANGGTTPTSGKGCTLSPNVEAFIEGLPKFVAMTMPFHISLKVSPAQEELCFCPCSKRMKTWWQQHNFDPHDESFWQTKTCKSSKGTNGLMAHLVKMVDELGNDDNEERASLYHKLAHQYLAFLYTDYLGPGVNHSALHKPGDDSFKSATLVQSQRLRKTLKHYQEENDRLLKEKEEAAASLEQMKMALDEKTTELIQARKDAVSKIEEAWGLTPRQKNPKPPSMARLKKQRSHLDGSFDMVRQAVEIPAKFHIGKKKDRPKKKEKSVQFQIAVEQQFSLNELFQQWYHEEDKPTLLDDDLPPALALYDWNVNFMHVDDALRDKQTGRKKRNSDLNDIVAIDHGGPSRAFLNAVWKQLDGLAVQLSVPIHDKNGKTVEDVFVKVPLFENTEEGLMPATNYRVRQELVKCCPVAQAEKKEMEKARREALRARAQSSQTEMTSKPRSAPLHSSSTCKKCAEIKKAGELAVQRYGRAIGRIILHAVSNQKLEDVDNKNLAETRRFSIASHVLPSIYCNYILRGASPSDEEEYPISDLVHDVIAAKYPKGKEVDQETVTQYVEIAGDVSGKSLEEQVKAFRDAAYDDFIEQRSIVLEGIRLGVQYGDGEVETLSNKLFNLRNDEVQALFFAKQQVEVEDVLAAIKPVEGVTYTDKDDDGVLMVPTQTEIIRWDEPTKQWVGGLVDILRDWEDIEAEMLSKFVEFVTGSMYLPATQAEIVVEFNNEDSESMSKESLPVAHTCVNTLKLPATAYGGDTKIFKQKLETSLKHCGFFDMG